MPDVVRPETLRRHRSIVLFEHHAKLASLETRFSLAAIRKGDLTSRHIGPRFHVASCNP